MFFPSFSEPSPLPSTFPLSVMVSLTMSSFCFFASPSPSYLLEKSTGDSDSPLFFSGINFSFLDSAFSVGGRIWFIQLGEPVLFVRESMLCAKLDCALTPFSIPKVCLLNKSFSGDRLNLFFNDLSGVFAALLL